VELAKETNGKAKGERTMNATKNRRTQIRRRRRLGQGMTEYIVLVGLIAIMLITAVGKFKGSLESAFGAAQSSIDTKVTKPMNDSKGT
jgi:Flp pilus assembly pilin Flp